jgi:hypothetical protein
VLIIWGWEQMLTGFEIIVASSNNVPAENISREIPTCGAIDGEDASYYPELATTVLNSDSIQHRKSPGAGSACLGRKSNRIKFANAFWFSDKRAGSRASRTSSRAMSGLHSTAGRLPCRPSAPHSVVNKTFAQNGPWCVRS